jgi:cholesterol transport system auxiliary component
MTKPSRRQTLVRAARWAGMVALGPLAGCGSLLPKPPPAPSLFALDDAAAPAAPRAAISVKAPTLIVSVPRAAAGFDGTRIVYVRQAHALEAFAYSQWVDTPALMLAPLIAQAIERTGAFRAVLRAPTAAAGELRLDTELIRLQHDFTAAPSRVRLTLRAVLVDTATRRVVAAREFDASVVSASDDAYGGVLAANEAVKTLLAELAGFCAQAAAALTATR